MLHFTYSVRMVVGIGIYFRARTLAAGTMCMGHSLRFAGKSINSVRRIITLQQIALNRFCDASLKVIIISRIKFCTAAKNSDHTTGDISFGIDCCRRKAGIIETGQTTEGIVVIIVYSMDFGRHQGKA